MPKCDFEGCTAPGTTQWRADSEHGYLRGWLCAEHFPADGAGVSISYTVEGVTTLDDPIALKGWLVPAATSFVRYTEQPCTAGGCLTGASWSCSSQTGTTKLACDAHLAPVLKELGPSVVRSLSDPVGPRLLGSESTISVDGELVGRCGSWSLQKGGRASLYNVRLTRPFGHWALSIVSSVEADKVQKRTVVLREMYPADPCVEACLEGAFPVRIAYPQPEELVDAEVIDLRFDHSSSE